MVDAYEDVFSEQIDRFRGLLSGVARWEGAGKCGRVVGELVGSKYGRVGWNLLRVLAVRLHELPWGIHGRRWRFTNISGPSRSSSGGSGIWRLGQTSLLRSL